MEAVTGKPPDQSPVLLSVSPNGTKEETIVENSHNQEEVSQILPPVMSIPRWFVVLFGAVIALVMPWGIWVSATLFEIRAQLATSVMLHEVTRSIDNRVDGHLTDPTIHRSALNTLDARITRAETEMKEIRALMLNLLTNLNRIERTAPGEGR